MGGPHRSSSVITRIARCRGGIDAAPVGEAQSVERVTRSTDLVRDHIGARKYAPYLQIC
jgi:hypothetical protein